MTDQLADNADSTTATPADNADSTTASDEKDIVNDGPGELLSNLERDFAKYQLEAEDSPLAGDDEPEGDEPEEEKPEPKAEEDPVVIETRNTQKRFDKFAQEIRELKSENDQLRTKAPIDTSSLVAPKPEDFEDGVDDPAYIAANGAHLGSVSTLDLINQNQQVENQARANLDVQNKANAYVKRTEAVRKEIKDFDNVIAGSLLDAVDVQGNLTTAALTLFEIDNGPEVAHHIASNPDLALALNRSTPQQVSLTIGKLSSQLSVVPHKVNKAPPPVRSEDKGGGPGVANDGLKNIGGAKFY